jgi:hypothetical protein
MTRHSIAFPPTVLPTALVAWLAIAVLLTQLLAMEFHHHSLFEVDNDCPSCQLDAMHPAPAPATAVLAPVPERSFAYHVAVEPAPLAPLDLQLYLSPYPQAPPQRPRSLSA